MEKISTYNSDRGSFYSFVRSRVKIMVIRKDSSKLLKAPRRLPVKDFTLPHFRKISINPREKTSFWCK